MGDAIDVVGALGVADASWLEGAGPVYDLAFVVGESPATGDQLASAMQVALTGQGHTTGGEWQDRLQGEILDGRRPGADAVARVDVRALRSRSTALPDVSAPGYRTWLYRSGVALPEGIVDGTAGGGLWAGPYQPYLVHVPEDPDGSTLLWLHGGGGNHLDVQFTDASRGGLDPGRAVLVQPFGRMVTTSQDHGYSGVGERDVLDVLDDAQGNYPLDPSRTVVSGLSTGGGGAFRLAQLHPDRFSAVLPFSAFDDTHLPANASNMEVVLRNGGSDPLISPPIVAATLLELDLTGVLDYRSYTVDGAEHADVAAPVTQCLLDGLLQRRVQERPARVLYGLDPKNTVPGVDLTHGRAYWLRDARLRPDAPASVWHTPAGDPPAFGDNAVGALDLTTLAVPVRTATYERVAEVGQNVTAGADLCGPAEVSTGDTWRVVGMKRVPGPPHEVRNALVGSLREVERFTVDVTRAGLSTSSPLELDLTGDGVTTVRLIGSWPGGPVPVTVDGARAEPARADGSVLELELDLSGRRVVRLG